MEQILDVAVALCDYRFGNDVMCLNEMGLSGSSLSFSTSRLSFFKVL